MFWKWMEFFTGTPPIFLSPPPLKVPPSFSQELIAEILKSVIGWAVPAILAAFFVLTILLTQPMSNAAAALVVLPVALRTAQELGVNSRTFAIAIMLAASISFVPPMEPSCIRVDGPGKYRFRDFVKVGLGLTLVLLPVALFLVTVFWPLHPPAVSP